MSSEFSFLFFSFLVLLFFIVNCIRLFLILERVAYDTCDSSHEYHMQLSKLFYFLKYFLYCVILSNFFISAKKKTKTQI
jgi:hypothetical protein